jgi:hypothetical protein
MLHDVSRMRRDANYRKRSKNFQVLRLCDGCWLLSYASVPLKGLKPKEKLSTAKNNRAMQVRKTLSAVCQICVSVFIRLGLLA